MKEVIIIFIICYFIYKIINSPVGMNRKKAAEFSAEIVKKVALEVNMQYNKELNIYEKARSEAISLNNPAIEEEAFIQFLKFARLKEFAITEEIESWSKDFEKNRQ